MAGELVLDQGPVRGRTTGAAANAAARESSFLPRDTAVEAYSHWKGIVGLVHSRNPYKSLCNHFLDLKMRHPVALY